MKIIKTLLLISIVFISTSSLAEYVRGHYRSNGTYVSGYNRSNRNSTKLDNYSTRGNVNPYTGAKGYKNPY